MCREDAKKGQEIAENLRKILLNIDLRIVYAEGERKLAQEDYLLNAKMGDKKHTLVALQAKARSECYEQYIVNIKKVKSEITFSLDAVLSRYTPKHKTIWTMYFLEKRSIDDIASAVNYSRESVNKIVQKLKLDLFENYADVD